MSFWAWINEEREKRDLSFRAIERVNGLANGTISSRENNVRPPTFKGVRAIARAFNLPIELVLRKAGMIPTRDLGEGAETLLHYYDQLADDDRRRMLAIGRTLAEESARYDATRGNGGSKRSG